MKKSAFTLIELSIVLVIIGLIVGGVLVGTELIEAAKMRKQMSDLEQLDSAVHTFRLKYNKLAGDLTSAQATSFGLRHSAAVDNGNKIINHYATGCICSAGLHSGVCLACSISFGGEPSSFFMQLDDAELIPYDISNNGNDLPNAAVRLALGNGFVYPTSSNKTGKNGYFLGMGSVVSNSHHLYTNAVETGVGAYDPVQAMQMDTKFDDGSPEFGRIKAARMHATWGMYEDWGPEGAYVRNCVTGAAGSRTYDLSTSPDDLECQLWVQGSW